MTRAYVSGQNGSEGCPAGQQFVGGPDRLPGAGSHDAVEFVPVGCVLPFNPNGSAATMPTRHRTRRRLLSLF